MSPDLEPGRPTRILFLGEESLADGFRLIGFETYPSPTPEEADRVIKDLLRNREKALVVLDDALMREDLPNLKRVRREGGRIVAIAVPRLSAPTALSSDVAERLAALFGVGSTEHTHSGESS